MFKEKFRDYEEHKILQQQEPQSFMVMFNKKMIIKWGSRNAIIKGEKPSTELFHIRSSSGPLDTEESADWLYFKSTPWIPE